YDKRSRPLTPLTIGQTVRLQNYSSKRWDRIGIIVGIGKHRDYHLKTPSGRVYWLNRRFLRPLIAQSREGESGEVKDVGIEGERFGEERTDIEGRERAILTAIKRSEIPKRDSKIGRFAPTFLEPESLHKVPVRLAHGQAHFGISSSKRRLRDSVWFLGGDKMVDYVGRSCPRCQLITKDPSKPFSRPHPTPKLPWETVSLDLFGPLPDNTHVLVLRCDLSRYPVTSMHPDSSTKSVVRAMANIFETYGLPAKIRSDYGTCLTSEEFKAFLATKEITHDLTPPVHPQSNPTECFMQVLKKAIRTTNLSPTRVFDAKKHAVNEYRRTPHPSTGLTPAQFMLPFSTGSLPTPMEHSLEQLGKKLERARMQDHALKKKSRQERKEGTWQDISQK
ncbi:hypothetical protein TCAL_13737, partial [Tigriopus californicus]